MRGITTETFAIIFSVIIMVVLIAVAIGFVHGKTDIPFEDLWEYTPETGTPTEKEHISDIIKSYNVDDVPATHIFTPEGGPHDLSEIACLIANDIYNDYSDWGTSSNRQLPVTIGPFSFRVGSGFSYSWSKEAFILDERSFIYKTGTNTTSAAEDELNATDYPKYKDCRICKIGGDGIIDLDETCINMNLKERTVEASNFCGSSDNDESFLAVKTGAKTQFGNCNNGDDRERNNDNVAGWADFSDGKNFRQDGCNLPLGCGCKNDDDDFCDNDREKLMWSAPKNLTPNYYNDRWKVDDQRAVNSELLLDGMSYMYGVYYIQNHDKYFIIFSLIPNGTAHSTNSWDDLYELFEKNFTRSNPMGFRFEKMRTIAEFNITPTDDIKIWQELITNISDAAGIYVERDDIDCKLCGDSGGLCNPGPIEATEPLDFMDTHGDCNLNKMSIRLRINATDNSGDPLISCNSRIYAGGKTYRVTVKNWAGVYYRKGSIVPGVHESTFEIYERIIIINEI